MKSKHIEKIELVNILLKALGQKYYLEFYETKGVYDVNVVLDEDECRYLSVDGKLSQKYVAKQYFALPTSHLQRMIGEIVVKYELMSDQ